ncbi:MAG: hypothetical protein Q6365_010000, partial [Candidatus Sigynarchaeota archaeon]
RVQIPYEAHSILTRIGVPRVLLLVERRINSRKPESDLDRAFNVELRARHRTNDVEKTIKCGE